MESHREAVEKYGSIESAAKAYNLEPTIFERNLEEEEKNEEDIEVPEYFNSYHDCHRYIGTYRAAERYSGIPKTTFGKRIEKERDQGLCFQVRPNDPTFRDSQGNPIVNSVVHMGAGKVCDAWAAREKVVKELMGDEHRDLVKENKSFREELKAWERKEQLFIRPTKKDLAGLEQVKNLEDQGSGMPMLLVTDIHYGEVVDEESVHGKNKYNPEIARTRISILTQKVIDLLTKHKVNTDYPGIIVCLGGDLYSGDIHEELSVTNADYTCKLFWELVNLHVEMIKRFKEVFGKVWVYNVPGNHGRMTQKKQSKVPGNNWDTLHGGALIRDFENDPNVYIHSSAATDVDIPVFEHIYCLTHGDELGRNSTTNSIAALEKHEDAFRGFRVQMGKPYDTLVVGHYHRTIFTGNLIVGGSMVGFNEHSKSQIYSFQEPQQALWISHPKYGVTDFQPIYLCN